MRCLRRALGGWWPGLFNRSHTHTHTLAMSNMCHTPCRRCYYDGDNEPGKYWEVLLASCDSATQSRVFVCCTRTTLCCSKDRCCRCEHIIKSNKSNSYRVIGLAQSQMPMDVRLWDTIIRGLCGECRTCIQYVPIEMSI